MKRRVASLLVVAFVCAARSAGAEGAAADDALIDRGVALREEGRDREALAEFERAYALRPTARARAQIALAHQALGDWVEAEKWLLDALGAADDPWIARNRAALDEALAVVRKHLGSIELDIRVAGASVTVDGVRAGTAPLAAPLRVVSGAHVVEIDAPGYERARRRFEVEPGAIAREVIALVALPAPPDSPASAQQAPRGSAAVWMASAAGGVFLTVGVVANVVRENNVAIYNDDSRCRFGGVYRDVRCGTNRQTAETATTVAIVGYAGAAAAAITAVTITLLRPRSAEKRSAVTCGPGAWLGIACSGAF